MYRPKRIKSQRERRRATHALNNPSKTDRVTCTLAAYRCAKCHDRFPFNEFYGSPPNILICRECRVKRCQAENVPPF